MRELEALGLTLLVEVPAYMTLLRATRILDPWRAALAGLAVNLVSQPLAFELVYPAWRHPLGAAGALAAVEAVVCGGEALGIWLVVGHRRLSTLVGVSYVANALSLAAGLLLLR